MAAKLNITVVEDHDALRAVTVEALRQQGHKVQGIACAEAIDAEAASAPSDLFIIDLKNGCIILAFISYQQGRKVFYGIKPLYNGFQNLR